MLNGNRRKRTRMLFFQVFHLEYDRTSLATSNEVLRIYQTRYHQQLRSGSAQQQSKRSEEHTSELQSRFDLVCRLLLEKKKKQTVVSEVKLDELLDLKLGSIVYE